MPEANATALPDSSPPTTSSSASQVGVPSSREYSRPLPIMKFDAGIGGTFNGAPDSEARPAVTSHDCSLIWDGCFSTQYLQKIAVLVMGSDVSSIRPNG